MRNDFTGSFKEMTHKKTARKILWTWEKFHHSRHNTQRENRSKRSLNIIIHLHVFFLLFINIKRMWIRFFNSTPFIIISHLLKFHLNFTHLLIEENSDSDKHDVDTEKNTQFNSILLRFYTNHWKCIVCSFPTIFFHHFHCFSVPVTS